MLVRFVKRSDRAVTPSKAHPTDAGCDLVATSKSRDEYGNVVYGVGLGMEIPEGCVGLVFPRSSNAKKDLILTNGVGVIDSHYRGEITFKFRPINPWWRPCREYEIGDRIGQIIIVPFPSVDWLEVAKLDDTDRGEGGYGSSGK